jgi:hypothetical protein
MLPTQAMRRRCAVAFQFIFLTAFTVFDFSPLIYSGQSKAWHYCI